MEMDPDIKLLEKQHLMSWGQLISFVDPFMVIQNEADVAIKAVEEEAQRLGLTIESVDLTFEIQVKAYAK